MALSFVNDNGMLGMALNLQTNDSSIKTQRYTSGLISYDDFFKKMQIGFRMMKGKLYYFGIYDFAMNNTFFAKYSGKFNCLYRS